MTQTLRSLNSDAKVDSMFSFYPVPQSSSFSSLNPCNRDPNADEFKYPPDCNESDIGVLQVDGMGDITDYICLLADHGEIPRSFPAHLSAVFAHFIKSIISPYNDPLISRERKDDIIKQLLASARLFQDIPPGARFGATLRSRINIVNKRREANHGRLNIEVFNFEGLSFEGNRSPPRLSDNVEDDEGMDLGIGDYENLRKRVIALVSTGSISKAAAAIEEEGKKKKLEDPLGKMQALYPPKMNSDPIPSLPIDAPDLNFPAYFLPKFLRKRAMDNAGPGPSGMTARHLTCLLKFPVLSSILHNIINDIANARIACPSLRLALTSGIAHGHMEMREDGSEKLRVLAPQEILYRLAADYTLHAAGKFFDEYFLPIQYSIGASGGSERAAIELQLAFERSRNNVLEKNDVKNAFGCIHRPKMFENLFALKQFKSTWRLSYMTYGATNCVVVKLPDGAYGTIMVERGGLQGDPLYPFLYCLTVQPAYLEALSVADDRVCGKAVMDDFQVVGLQPDTTKVIERYGQLLVPLGLSLAPNKSKLVSHNPSALLAESSSSSQSLPSPLPLYSFSSSSHEPLDFQQPLEPMHMTSASFSSSSLSSSSLLIDSHRPSDLLSMSSPSSSSLSLLVPSALSSSSAAMPQSTLLHSQDGVNQLGTRFGPRSAMDSQWMDGKVDSVIRLIDLIKNIHLPRQVALLLLRFCVISKLIYVMRTMPPDSISSSLIRLDYAVLNGFCEIFDIDPANLTQEDMIQLSLPVKRGGFGLPRCEHLAPICFVSAMHNVVVASDGQPDQRMYMQPQYDKFVRELKTFGLDVPDPGDHTTDKLQHSLTDQLMAKKYDDLFESVSDMGKARLMSLSQKYTGSVLTSIPKASVFRLTDREMTDYVHLRLGKGLSFSEVRDSCGACGERFGSTGEEKFLHALCCAKMKRTTQLLRHNSVQNQIASAVKDIAYHVTNAPRFDGNIPDMEIYFKDNITPLLVEVSITHPASATNISKHHSHLYPLASSKNREREKILKYQRFDQSVCPAVMESFGAVGPEFSKFVQLITRKICDGDPGKTYRHVFNDIISTLQFSLQKGNSACISKCLFGSFRPHKIES